MADSSTERYYLGENLFSARIPSFESHQILVHLSEVVVLPSASLHGLERSEKMSQWHAGCGLLLWTILSPVKGGGAMKPLVTDALWQHLETL
ncbi:MAG TPA: hypothetical protein VH643_29025, partial [Gemmataceae bacterium]